MGHQYAPLELYDRAVSEDAGDAFAVDERVATEQAPYTDEPFMEELKGLDLFDSIRAALPDPAGDAAAVRGNNLPRSVVSTQHLASGTMTCRRLCTNCGRDNEDQTVHYQRQM